MQEFFSAILNQVNSIGSRSTVLKELKWIITIFLSAIYFLVDIKASDIMLYIIGVMLFFTFLTFLYTHLICLKKNPELLRSESYSLNKLKIEKGYIGDNLHGLSEIDLIKKLPIGISDDGNKDDNNE